MALDGGPIEALADRWRRDAERFRAYGDERGARTCELHAGELEAALRAYLTEELTVAEAAEASGYSESHLRALLAEERLANVGREGAPRIRRGDLPAKPKAPTDRPRPSLADEALERRLA